MSSDDEEENNDEEAVKRRMEMGTWFKFCKEKVDKIEKVWNKKLEDDKIDDDQSEEKAKSEASDDEKDKYEKQLSEMFANFNARNLSKSFQGSSNQDPDLA